MDAILEELLRHGVALVGLNVLLQQLGLPIPSVPTMMVAGALALDGRISGAGAFTVAVAASVVADVLWFAGGRRFGYRVLKLLCRMSLSPDACVRQTEGIFERWGFYSLVVSKFVPGFSTVAPPMAGALRMRMPQFLLATVASAVLWVGAAMGAGALFRREIEWLLGWMSRHAALAGLALGVLLAIYVAHKAWQRWKLARHVEGAMIGAAELAARLAGAHRRSSSTLAHGSRTSRARTFRERCCSTSMRSAAGWTRSPRIAASCSIARAPTRYPRSAPRRSCLREAIATYLRSPAVSTGGWRPAIPWRKASA